MIFLYRKTCYTSPGRLIPSYLVLQSVTFKMRDYKNKFDNIEGNDFTDSASKEPVPNIAMGHNLKSKSLPMYLRNNDMDLK